jgi:phytoene dehydrogenase-like protein
MAEQQRSICIIGAGIGGLSAGCYGQMNGYRTTIFERHTGPGGVCTAWAREGYTFDGCLHNLAGSSPHVRTHELWRELGVVPSRPMMAFDEFVRIERPDGRAFTVYTDLDRLERHMKELSREDTRLIEELTGAARALRGFDLLSFPMMGVVERLPMIAYAPALVRWGRIRLDEYAARFTDPFLREALPRIIYDWPSVPMAMALGFLAGLHNRDLGWAAGGSLEFSRAIERRYRELGGELHYEARVEKILVEEDRACGVRLSDGSEHPADVVVSNADGRTTIYDMLDGRYTNGRIRRYYAHPIERQEMTLHVSYGVARELSAEPHAILLFLDEPITIAGEAHDHLNIEHFAFDPTMAPPGKSVLKVVLRSSYRYWKDLHREADRYAQEKQRIAAAILERLERRFPGLAAQVEAVDVSTPVTLERYTGAWQGFQAWPPDESFLTTLSGLVGRGWCRTLPGLRAFYMVGQWAGDAGLPVTAAAGRNLIKRFCRRDGRRFVASRAS